MTLWFVLNALREQAGERKGLRPGGNYNEDSLSNQSVALEGVSSLLVLGGLKKTATASSTV